MNKFILYNLIFVISLAIITLPLDALATQSDLSTEIESVDGKDPGYVKGVTPARARSLVGGFIGLLSLILGWRAKARLKSNVGASRGWSITAVALGALAIVLSIIHLTYNTGGFGTGGGKAGAIVALLLGLCGAALGWLTLRRHRLSAQDMAKK